MNETIAELERRLALLQDEDSREAVDLRNLLAGEIAVDDPERCRLLTTASLAMADRLGYEQGRAYALGFLGFAHYLVSDHEAAGAHLVEAAALMRRLEDDAGLGRVLSSLAAVHLSLGDYESALADSFAALDAQRAEGQREAAAWTLQGIGGGYVEMKDYARARQNFEEALAIFTELGQDVGRARALNGLGGTFQGEGRLDDALDHHRRSLEIFERADNPLGTSRALNDIGEILLERGDLTGACAHHERALRLREQYGNRQAMSTSLINLGRVHTARGDADAALEALERSLRIAEEIKARPRIFQTHEALSRAWELAGDRARALDHHRLFHRIKEEVAGEQTAARIKNLQVSFAVTAAEREAEISRLRNVELKAKNRKLEDLLAELGRTQSQLVQAEKMASLGALVAGLLHELNNPLGALNSAADVTYRAVEVLRRELPEGSGELARNRSLVRALAALESGRGVAAESIARIRDVVGSLERFVHLDGATRGEVDLNGTVAATLTLLAPVLRGRVTVVTSLGKVPRLWTNPHELNQVVLDVIANTAAALPENGTLEVSTRRREDDLLLELADPAGGLDADRMAALLDPRFQQQDGRVRAELGLAGAHAMVERLGGRLTVGGDATRGALTLSLPLALAG